VTEWLQEYTPTRARAVHYIRSLFPFVEWLPRYNRTWFLGDIVAGITIGAVVVPQGMAYAKIANLPPEYGLYSSFVGVLLYFPFATSKEYALFFPCIISSILILATALLSDLSQLCPF
jgi:solute carrier family 26 (sodium-independent sulfate anion transporter), member 11